MNKDQFLKSMLHEINVAKHLFAKLPPGSYDWRPSPGQRSMTELLRYLTYCGIGIAKAAYTGSFDAVKPYREEAATMPAERFPQAMDRQAAALEEFLAGVSDADFQDRDVSLPPIMVGKLGEALVNASLKFLAAYRMQLFLYAKMTGARDLDTWDCWRGMTNPQKAAAASGR